MNFDIKPMNGFHFWEGLFHDCFVHPPPWMYQMYIFCIAKYYCRIDTIVPELCQIRCIVIEKWTPFEVFTPDPATTWTLDIHTHFSSHSWCTFHYEYDWWVWNWKCENSKQSWNTNIQKQVMNGWLKRKYLGDTYIWVNLVVVFMKISLMECIHKCTQDSEAGFFSPLFTRSFLSSWVWYGAPTQMYGPVLSCASCK